MIEVVLEGCAPHVVPLGKLAVGPCPKRDNVGADLSMLRQQGYDVVVSMLTADDKQRLGLSEEERLCRAYGMEYLNLPVPDQSPPPENESAVAFFKDLRDRYLRGQYIYVHCMHGLGRAPSAVAGVLVLMGMDTEEAYRVVEQARGVIQVTPGQWEWVDDLRMCRDEKCDGCGRLYMDCDCYE